MHYRQYLQGVGWTGPVGGTANVPIAETASAGTTLPLDAQWHEEDLATVLGKNLLQTGCSREVTDRPGIERGARAGVPVMMRYNLYLQIWDACQQRELWHDARALTIGGNTPPRTILWSSSHQPLSRASISSDILAEETAEEPLETRRTVAQLPARSPDPATHAFMGPRVGHDFSAVQIHADTAGKQSLRRQIPGSVPTETPAAAGDYEFERSHFCLTEPNPSNPTRHSVHPTGKAKGQLRLVECQEHRHTGVREPRTP